MAQQPRANGQPTALLPGNRARLAGWLAGCMHARRHVSLQACKSASHGIVAAASPRAILYETVRGLTARGCAENQRRLLLLHGSLVMVGVALQAAWDRRYRHTQVNGLTQASSSGGGSSALQMSGGGV
jgi:hypothetical protein